MSERRHMLVIDLLRVAAAFGVVLHHLVAVAAVVPASPYRLFPFAGPLPRGGSWAAPGSVGVELFFVISGYVIAQSTAGTTPAAFVRRRLLRLVPAAWLCASLTTLVLLAFSTLPAEAVATRWWSALLFVPRELPVDPSYWTLELELAFYLLVALALRHGGARGAERATLALGVASAATLLAGFAAGMAPDGLDQLQFRLTLMPYGVFFALGALLAAGHARGVSGRGLALGGLFAAGALTEIVLHARSTAIYIPDAPGAWAPAVLFAGAMALIVAAHLLQMPLARRVGTARLTRWSAATYPLYLLHQVIGAALIAAATYAGLPTWLATLLAIVGVVALALLVSEQAEPVLKRWLQRALSVRRDPASDTLPIASLPGG